MRRTHHRSSPSFAHVTAAMINTRIGKHIRFRVEHLDELVAAGEQPVTSEVIPIQRNRTRSKL
jgi:hypothetical protein